MTATRRVGQKELMQLTAVPVVHPTDFSELSRSAFAHALRIGLAAHCRLYVVHVAERQSGDPNGDPWLAFPHVRETLARWGLCEKSEPPAAVFEKLEVEVAKVEIEPQDPVDGLTRFLAGHPSGLMVLATQGREGLPRFIRPSIAEAMSRRAATQTLFIPPHGRGFVDAQTGLISLKRILVPVDHHPPAAAAIGAVRQFCRALGAEAEIQVLHIGTVPPVLAPVCGHAHRIAVDLRTGPGSVVDGILQAATREQADLICMATAGHDGPLDALRGSTTERVLRQAPCPVLAIPVA
jgi:nucleotide-binding universal stress UspA family protein